MPDDHCVSMLQVTAVDDQFGTHSSMSYCRAHAMSPSSTRTTPSKPTTDD
jgi:hypothetical protein